MNLALGIALSVAFAALLYALASWRGADPLFWAVMGFVLGPLAIPFVFFARREGGDDRG